METKTTKRRGGFTLIELLIVVAIIAILAAIAVPNFLEAQTRAKVSRVKADLRTFATAIEAYLVDNNRMPRTYRPNANWTRVRINAQFTTPVAYITSVSIDPFNNYDSDPLNRAYVLWGTNPNSDSEGVLGYLDAISQGTRTAFFKYYPNFYNPNTNSYQDSGAWLAFSAGPDRIFSVNVNYPGNLMDYDPTNGTISPGDVIRWKD
jgi:prepilin-type N-terminal cleavage/methylation domain-containing protein